MTGSRRGPATRLLWAGGMVLAGPALAQIPGIPAPPAPPEVPSVLNQLGGASPSAAPAPTALGPLPRATLDFGSLSGPPNDELAENARLDYGGELTINADHLRADLPRDKFDATGHVYAHERDTTLRADRLLVDSLSRLGFSEHVFLTRRPYTLRAARVDFQPGRLVATRADVTTANPGDTNPNIGLVADTMTLTPVVSRKGVVDPYRYHADLWNAKFYLFHNRILTLPHFATTLGNDPRTNQQSPRPTFGYSGRDGYFVGYGGGTTIGRDPYNYSVTLLSKSAPQARVTGQQVIATALPPRALGPAAPAAPVTPTLSALRALTTAPHALLPDGDPLLFHDFLPDTNPVQLFNPTPPAYLVTAEEVSSHIETLDGRNGSVSLYVSRLPDFNVYTGVPLGPVYQLPTSGDPAAFRRYLRRPAVYAGLTGEAARFREDTTTSPSQPEPGRTAATRLTYAFRLSTRPLLVAPNTVLVPAYTYARNHYADVAGPFPGRQFDYGQYSIALQHYISNYSGVGLQYFDNQTRGATPLSFDTFAASRELDMRLQVGDRKLAVAGSLRYDVLAHHTIDYTVTVAPGLRGFTPVFSYRSYSQSFGVSLAIPGLTF